MLSSLGEGWRAQPWLKCWPSGGVRVLVFERETAFRDRVRGEQMHPWGVAEARKLGLYELLLETCGSEVRYWSGQLVGFSDVTRRDLFETSSHRAGSLNFYHPDMQSVVTAAAEKAGATILRGAGRRIVGGSAGFAWTRMGSTSTGRALSSARMDEVR
jgi:menaquinone-9 beta-reductase